MQSFCKTCYFLINHFHLFSELITNTKSLYVGKKIVFKKLEVIDEIKNFFFGKSLLAVKLAGTQLENILDGDKTYPKFYNMI